MTNDKFFLSHIQFPTYAIGRELEIGDRPDVDSIVDVIQNASSGLRDLIGHVVLSESFRNN
ncbi:MAG TPA: DUF1585 domain-containing protein [Planctomycetes bacterium]|nr:DUF1585 domain-containing protein [Fuerstiella sp.]HIK95993.1 DUF1585 domain-containing protein [Planctomycetota bacterium]